MEGEACSDCASRLEPPLVIVDINITPQVSIMKKIAKLLLPCLLLLLAGQGSVKANDGLAMAYMFGYGGYGGARMQSYVPAPPYFALHPPVYYGQRYTRPYGVSPFAAWPQLQPNAAYAPQQHVQRAAVLDNPYCGSEVIGVLEASAKTTIQAAPTEPLVIDNPYFQPEARFTSAN